MWVLVKKIKQACQRAHRPNTVLSVENPWYPTELKSEILPVGSPEDVWPDLRDLTRC